MDVFGLTDATSNAGSPHQATDAAQHTDPQTRSKVFTGILLIRKS